MSQRVPVTPEQVVAALIATQGHRKRAARMLGLSGERLRTIMNKRGLASKVPPARYNWTRKVVVLTEEAVLEAHRVGRTMPRTAWILGCSVDALEAWLKDRPHVRKVVGRISKTTHEAVAAALAATGGRRDQAAVLLGVTYGHLVDRINSAFPDLVQQWPTRYSRKHRRG